MHAEPVERIHRVSYCTSILVLLNYVDQALSHVLVSCSRRCRRVYAKHDERPECVLAYT